MDPLREPCSFLDDDTDAQCEDFGRELELEYIHSQKRNFFRLVEEQVDCQKKRLLLQEKPCAEKVPSRKTSQIECPPSPVPSHPGQRFRGTPTALDRSPSTRSSKLPTKQNCKSAEYSHHSSMSDSECDSLPLKSSGKRIIFSDETARTPKCSSSRSNLAISPKKPAFVCRDSPSTSSNFKQRYSLKPSHTICSNETNELRDKRKTPPPTCFAQRSKCLRIFPCGIKSVVALLVLTLLAILLGTGIAHDFCKRTGYCNGCSADGFVRYVPY